MGIRSISSIVRKAKNSIGKVVTAGKQAIKKVSNNIKNKVSSIVKKIKSTVGNTVKAVKSICKNILVKAKSTIGNTIKATKQGGGKIKEEVKAIKKVGVNILDKLKNQMKEIKEDGFFNKAIRGRTVKGAKSYYIKDKEEFIKSLNTNGEIKKFELKKIRSYNFKKYRLCLSGDNLLFFLFYFWVLTMIK